MDQSICTVHIKEIFQVIFVVTCRSFKDSLSILTSLITIQEQERRQLREIGGAKLKSGGQRSHRNPKAFCGRNHKI